MLTCLTIADLGLTPGMTNAQALAKARELWGPRALAYISTTNGFCFIALWPNIDGLNPEGIMPSDILGYGLSWPSTFAMALQSIPVLLDLTYLMNLLSPEPEDLPPDPPSKSLNTQPFEITKKSHNAKNWITDKQSKIPQPGPKSKLKPKMKGTK